MKQTLTKGSKFAIATHAAKNLGFRGFKKGSSGHEKKKEIAEAIARKSHVVPGKSMKAEDLKRAAARRASKR